MKKQRGAVDAMMIMVLVILVSISVIGGNWIKSKRLENEAIKGAEQYKMAIAAVMRYRHVTGAWPANTAQLVPSYLSAETLTMPWGNTLGLTQSGQLIQLFVDIPNVTIRGLFGAQVPAPAISGIRVTGSYGPPGSEPALSAFLKKDGSTPLTGEWDVGNQNIGNIRDMSISGLDNRTVVSGLSWSTVQQNYQVVQNLVNCPPRYTRKVTVIPGGYSKNGYPFNNAGSVEARYDGGRAYVRIWEKEVNGSQAWFIPAPQYAWVTVLQQCTK